jgi:hypothetical protein
MGWWGLLNAVLDDWYQTGWATRPGRSRMLSLAEKPPKIGLAGRRKSRSAMPRLCQNQAFDSSACLALFGQTTCKKEPAG